jgi:hypothetical protein
VIADELGGGLAPRLVGQIGEFRAGLLLQEDGEHVVLAPRAGAAHLERRGGGLGAVGELLHAFVRQLRIRPQHELIERDHRDRREVAPVERNLRRQRQHVDQRIGDEHLVRVAVARFHVDQRLGSRRAALERDHHRLLHQTVLLNCGLHHPRHLVGRSARAGGNDDFHRLVWFPRHGRRGRQRERQCRGTA